MKFAFQLLLLGSIAFGQVVPQGNFRSPVGSLQLDSLANDKGIVSVSPATFVSQNSRFEFTSVSKDSARLYDKRLPLGEVATFASIPVIESIMRFNEGGNELTLVLYAIGDKGEIGEESFQAMVKTLTDSLNKSFGKSATPVGSVSTLVRAKSMVWKCPAGNLSLEWSNTRANPSRGQAYRSEFIRVIISSSNPSRPLAAKPVKWIPAEQLRSTSSGDKWITSVPMVDQGQKGYCAVATAERVLRYYGKDADQHELAQLCQTSEGTSTQMFEQQIKRVSSRFDLRYQVFLSAMDEKFISGIVKDYSRAGKRKGGVACPPDLERYNQLFYRYIDTLNAGQLVAIRHADSGGLARMERYIRDAIDRADPVIWGVQLGLVPEPGIPQSRGGHKRLIIGYNSKTSEVLYTDSWGPGHELKRMKMKDAWAITFSLSILKP